MRAVIFWIVRQLHRILPAWLIKSRYVSWLRNVLRKILGPLLRKQSLEPFQGNLLTQPLSPRATEVSNALANLVNKENPSPCE